MIRNKTIGYKDATLEAARVARETQRKLEDLRINKNLSVMQKVNTLGPDSLDSELAAEDKVEEFQ